MDSNKKNYDFLKLILFRSNCYSKCLISISAIVINYYHQRKIGFS